MKIRHSGGVFSYQALETERIDFMKLINNHIFQGEKCYFCNMRLNPAYVFIIKKLKQFELLDRKYKFRCCGCQFIFDKVGTRVCKSCGRKLSIKGTRIRCIGHNCENKDVILWERFNENRL